MTRRKLLQIAVGLVTAGVLATACTSSEERAVPGAVGPIGRMLELVPDTASARALVTVSDFERIRAVNGVDLPPPDAAEAEAGTYVEGILGQPRPDVATGLAGQWFLRGGSAVEDFRTQFGFSVLDVDAMAETPDDQGLVRIMRGRIDAARVEAAVTSDPAWSDDLERAQDGGTTFYRWGEDDGANPSRISPVRPKGEGGRLWINDGVAVFTRTDASMQTAISAVRNDERPLGRDPAYAAAARELDRRDAYSAAFVASEAAGLEEIRVNAWDVVAIGELGTGHSQREVMVLAYDDAGQASAEARTLEEVLDSGTASTGEPWSQLLTSCVVELEDGVVVARCDPAKPGVLRAALTRGELPLD